MAEPEEVKAIEVRVREVSQLFNSLDPSPFHERDLDDDAEEFIVGSARELPHAGPLCIVVHLPESQAQAAAERGLEVAFRNFFAYRADRIARNLRALFRTGRRHLMIGLPLLAICLVASQMIGNILGPHPWSRVIEESFIILGWVANWKPLEIFLYDWWPIRRDLELHRRLAEAKVEIRTT
jgi:hypothetical protein